MEQALIEDLVKEVRITLDENRLEYSYLEENNTDNMDLNEIIRAKLLDSIRIILEACPVSLLSPIAMSISEEGKITGDDGSGTVTLPEDFLRLVSFKLKTWNRAVVNAAEEGSSIDLMQRNTFTRGTPIKPVCVFSHNEKGERTMEYFTAGKDSGGKYDHAIQRALYVKIPSVTENNDGQESVIIPKLLRFAIINYCAGLTETSRGNTEFGQVFFNIATSSLTRTNNS